MLYIIHKILIYLKKLSFEGSAKIKIQKLHINSYESPLSNGQMRSGALICITDETGNVGWGDIAPLPGWSLETLEQSLKQLDQEKDEIIKINWTSHSCFRELAKLDLFPGCSFALESALLSILAPLPEHSVPTSALLMGSEKEVLAQAKLRKSEGFTSAKLKVGHLGFKEAESLIHQLKDQFRLRIDVNRAWSTQDALQFFAQFPLDTFDYVEEPFQNPHDLSQFLHPLAVDESFPRDLSLEELELLPTLEALIYKPTMQGGLLGCFPLHEWTTKKGISLVLSSSFESDLGLAHIASMAHRLSLVAPIGIGTYHHLSECICNPPLKFVGSLVTVPSSINAKTPLF